ncbi:TetR/AcrR family transcriptional regulator [Corynebacterium yudongzhengii]|uniref:TetR/AcrR family transcriptional regulator n=1 Tax=Corynebacterium yudongzhengii TaxID=2080740 RepID=A0A2U1T6M9_9CORY|nr:TetR/AcrR family transcriptional regulator [Corynebacterium yudongzhengii]AWB81640.1 TetR/AcrR family transcriptional regulator [Corynebacterium yudongzhengii]PWC01625.1 TetR/AcrR family transcriptional regulator [Corynebacterium yudongzhengii]
MKTIHSTDRPVDGRTTRWDEHRRQRKKELSRAALRAIRKKGAHVGMGEIAEEAGTSKTVYYRHFGDRAGLWSALTDRTVDFIIHRLSLDETTNLAGDEIVAKLADAYLTLVERDPEIYEFVSAGPGPTSDTDITDPVVHVTSRIGIQLAAYLRRIGYDDRAEVFAQAIVGAIWAAADRWVANDRRRSKAEVVAQLHELFQPGLTLPPT